ncbi:HD domain-containing phosphohydrolase [Candidatus Omnitrophota bacterium]
MNTKNYSTHTKKYKLILSINHMVYRLISSTFDLKELALRLAKLITQLLKVNYCSIVLFDHAKSNQIIKAEVSGQKKHIVEKSKKRVSAFEAKIIKAGTSLLTKSWVCVPLVGEDTLGVILIKGKKKPFELFDKEALTAIAEQAVVAIKNLQLYEEQQKLIFGSIKSLVTLLDKKVPHTYTHTPRISRIILGIAEKMHLSESQMRILHYAGLLHDAGKIDIPLEILTKRKKLSQEEFNIIKSHPLKGAEIIKPLEILKPLVPVILYHHEKYDGSGYPSGLKKGQIPLAARIMSVADAFEAMMAQRPYRKNLITIKEAIEEIKKNSGTQFDPKVVNAFLELTKEKKFKKYLSNNK